MKTFSKANFFSFNDIDYSRTGTFLTGIDMESSGWRFYKIGSSGVKGIFELRKKINTNMGGALNVVMSGSQILVLYLRIFSPLPIILDAGWSGFESTMIRTRNSRLRFFKVPYVYFIDFLAFFFAKCILVESSNEKIFISRKFLVPQSKLLVIPTGCNEYAFNNSRTSGSNDTYNNFEKIVQQKEKKMILVRGKNVAESGLHNFAAVTHIMNKNECIFLIITNRIDKSIFNTENTIVITDFVDGIFLAAAYKACTLVIGQLSKEKRLERTIPHKAFEAAFFSRPYLTLATSALLEFFPDESIVILSGLSTDEIVAGIRNILENESMGMQKGELMGLIYKNHYSQGKLQEDFKRVIASISPD